MYPARPVGLGVVILGAVLLGFAYHFSQAPMDQLSDTLTGHYTDNTTWYMIAGIVAIVCGGLVAAFGKRI